MKYDYGAICWERVDIKIKITFVKREADLQRVNLREADLQRVNLRGADLRGADLRGADLRGADLREADLRGADLRGADLREADLWGADLRRVNLRGADLREVDLRGAVGIIIIQFVGFSIYVQLHCIAIGCQFMSFYEWKEITDKQAIEMGAQKGHLVAYRLLVEAAYNALKSLE